MNQVVTHVISLFIASVFVIFIFISLLFSFIYLFILWVVVPKCSQSLTVGNTILQFMKMRIIAVDQNAYYI